MGGHAFKARQQRGEKAPLFGLSLCSFDPAFVEISANFGIDIIWIEMEHANITMPEAEHLCRIVKGNEMLSLIRLPSGDRNIVLRAAESGADMLMLPMVDGVSDLSSFVKHARYSPLGERGFHRLSRSMNYGLGETIAELRARANDNLMLWGQVETLAALRNLTELCAVDGIDGLFAGPGDLSSAYGVPGNTSDPRVVEALTSTISVSHQHAKCAGTAATPEEAPRWMQLGIDMLLVGNNLGFYISAAQLLRSQLNQAFEVAGMSPTS